MALGRVYRPVIDAGSCQTCCVCLKGCPAEVLPELQGEEGTLRGAAYGGMPSSAPEPLPPCQAACPVGQRVREYVGELARGRWKEAALAIRRENPLPSVCGYLCHHPCQTGCLRDRVDVSVAVRELKRAAARYEREHPEEVRSELLGRRRAPNGRRVAVVGSGPAGLTAAHDLLLAGCAVTILEAAPALGGMLRLAIPGFRLPRDVLEYEISTIEALGASVETGRRLVAPEDLARLRAEFDAVLLALGAPLGSGLGIPGWEGPGCLDALALLGAYNRGEAPALSGAVLVVGGGNVALDAARAALRSGAAEVRVVYRRDRADMPADPEELAEAENEGVRFEYRLLPGAVERGGGDAPSALVCRRTELGPGEGRGRALVALPDSQVRLPAQWIVSAVGQRAEHPFLPEGAVRADGRLLLGSDGQVPGHPGLFGAGDGVTGPSYVVQAMASGRSAAGSILAVLEGTA